jgi:hypothetical protein
MSSATITAEMAFGGGSAWFEDKNPSKAAARQLTVPLVLSYFQIHYLLYGLGSGRLDGHIAGNEGIGRIIVVWILLNKLSVRLIVASCRRLQLFIQKVFGLSCS